MSPSKIINKYTNPFKVTSMLLFSLFVAVAGALCWMVIAPSGDLLFYQEAYNVVFIEGIVAFATNVASSLLIGIPIIYGLMRLPLRHSVISK